MKSPHLKRSFRPLVGLATVAAVLAGCAEDAPQDTFKPKGPNARTIDDLQRPLFYVAGVVGLIVFAAVGYSLLRFKDRGQEMPEQTHGKTWLEVLLTVIPALILVGVGIPTVAAVFDLDDQSNECVINVTGQQWWWEYDYSGTCGGVEITAPIVTSGELVIPAGTPVLLRITSRDVIHSYWIPALNGKRDAVPGRLHTLRLEADEPGIYTGQCTEFCGLSHARMRQAAVALSVADFQTWVDNQLEPYADNAPAVGTLAAEGEATFISQCSRCHQVNELLTADGTPVLAEPDLYVVSGSAPNLTNLMTRTAIAGWTFDLLTERCREQLWNAPPDEFGSLYLQGVWMNTAAGAAKPVCFDEATLRDWLRDPGALKPMYADPLNLDSTGGRTRGMPNLHLTEAQIDQLIAFLLERN
ncbi:MAG: cytochrome c oxidase subunit II [Actinobacteria bacterium]|nr:cytochrome c oxidase subunit II [Actinomycetota bacterium]